MKVALVSCCLLFFCGTCFAQVDFLAKQRTNPLYLLGKPIEKYKSALICADAFRLGVPYSDTSLCQSYRYVLNENDSAYIAAVNFHDLVLSIDKKKRINSIFLNAPYKSTPIASKEALINNDFYSLANFFTTFFNRDGKEKKNRESGRTTLYWKMNGSTLYLEKLQSQKENGNVVTMIWVTINPQ